MVIVAYSDSGHVEKELENKIRVETTKEILEQIDKLQPPVLENQVFAVFMLYFQRSRPALALPLKTNNRFVLAHLICLFWKNQIYSQKIKVDILI